MGAASEKKTLVTAARAVAGHRPVGYEGPVRLSLIPATLVLLAITACKSLPPAITLITVTVADTLGSADGNVWRTQLPPPFSLLGVRPGADPRDGAPFLNRPANGHVAITLARGVQNFLLYAAGKTQGPRHVIAIFLDGETAPALSAVVSGNLSEQITPTKAAVIMGADGEAVVNVSAAAVVRNGYRVTLTRAAFPLPGVRVDAVSTWRFYPDGAPDMVGVITLLVEPVAAR